MLRLSILASLAGLLLSCADSRPSPAPFHAASKLLDTIPVSIPADHLQFNPDGQEVAYRWVAPDGRQGFAINGRIERYFDVLKGQEVWWWVEKVDP